MLLGAGAPALAQFADLQAPARVLVAEAFSIDIVIPCPPPGEAPPTVICSGVFTYFVVSDKTATYPQELLFIQANEPLRVGPFTFHRRGTHIIELYTEFGPIGATEFLVEARRRK